MKRRSNHKPLSPLLLPLRKQRIWVWVSTLFLAVATVNLIVLPIFLGSLPLEDQQQQQQQQENEDVHRQLRPNHPRHQDLDDSNNSTATHKIPPILIFTHYVDLLHTPLEDLPDDGNNNKDELRVLQQNVHHTIHLHPEATSIRFLTDTDCVQSIRDAVPEYAHVLIPYFQNETAGMYKADLCRGVALYQTGGLYFDVDLGVRTNIFAVLNRHTEFVTIRVHKDSLHPGGFFQAFIGVAPRHFIMKRYIEQFVRYAQHQLHDVDGPLGVLFLQRAYHDHPPEHCELWQEILYHPDLQHTILKDVPPPTWGKRRACKFIVATKAKLPLIVPFYSRIGGSRMCPLQPMQQ